MGDAQSKGYTQVKPGDKPGGDGEGMKISAHGTKDEVPKESKEIIILEIPKNKFKRGPVNKLNIYSDPSWNFNQLKRVVPYPHIEDCKNQWRS